MVSWFVKQGLLNLARDMGLKFDEPGQDDREEWAKLMKKVGVKGVHIAERDTAHHSSEAAQRLLEHLVRRRLHL